MPEAMQEKVQEPKGKNGVHERLLNVFRIDQSKPEPLVTKLFRSVSTKYSVTCFAEMFALGFYRYIGHSVEFPAFPNLLDSVGMGLIGSYLAVDALRTKADSPIDKVRAAVKLGLSAVAMGLSISFPESFNHFAVFQSFPNELYTIGFGVISVYTFADIVRDIRKHATDMKLDQESSSKPFLPHPC